MKPSKVTRTKTAKSRAGCRRCKIRRLKCDEGAPECNNCLRRGFQCPGYKQELRWSIKHECSLGVDSTSASDTLATTKTAKREHNDYKDLANDGIGASSGQVLISAGLGGDGRNSSSKWKDPLWTEDCTNAAQPTSASSSALFVSAGSALTSLSPNGSASNLELLQDRFVSSAQLDAPIDLPTTLVEYWFSNICPMWSTFDSEINYNRLIPLETLHSSEPVFFALQAMSAVCLADSVPQINLMVPSLITQATGAIKKKLSAWRSSPNIPTVNITIDLLFAVFAMGTSLHWTDSVQLGNTLFYEAREALCLWARNLTSVDAVIHAYFHQALIYWEMLLPLADGSSSHEGLSRKKRNYQLKLRKAMQFGTENDLPNELKLGGRGPMVQSAEPHPWCGVSSEVIDVFGQVLALCRSSRTRHKKGNTLTVAATSETLCDIGLAHDLRNEILEMSFDAAVALDSNLQGILVQTGDEKTPIMHLVLAAEAYRQASLIQLYLTFEDLEVKSSAKQHASIAAAVAKFAVSDNLSRSHKLVAMALQLAAILQQIPADSGSRCIQPILLILAAAGLKLDSNVNRKQSSTGGNAQTIGFSAQMNRNSGTGFSNTVFHEHPHVMDDSPVHQSSSTKSDSLWEPDLPVVDLSMTRATFEVSKARKFVKSRLSVLRELLPPRPIQIAIELINAIWAEYDDAGKGSSEPHWLDVMSDTGLETMFG